MEFLIRFEKFVPLIVEAPSETDALIEAGAVDPELMLAIRCGAYQCDVVFDAVAV